MKQKTLLIVTATVLLLVFITGSLLYKRNQADQSALLADLHSASLIRPHSPTFGKADAPVVIVEFLDPACGTCQAFYPLVKDMLEEHPDKIRLVLRYAPFHDGSEKVVAVLEAARKQGKFWPALEALLETQDDWKPKYSAEMPLVWKNLAGLGLNLEQMRVDMTDPEIARLIAQDLADANTLKVTSTPEFFVNGKPLPRFGYGPLKQVVDEELKAHPSQPPPSGR